MKTLKQPKTGYKEPKSLVDLNQQIQGLHASMNTLASLRRGIVKAHKNIEQIHQQAYEDGVPGSLESFYTPVFALEDSIDDLVNYLNGMKASCLALRSSDPEIW